MTNNEIVSKLNNAWEYLTQRRQPLAGAAGVRDLSLIVFNALVYAGD